MKTVLKNIFIISMLFISIQGCVPMYYSTPTQGSVVVEQPQWAPSFDNRNMIQYYYFPDWGMYYDVRNSEYVYMDEGNWFFSRQVPMRYASYDFSSAYVVGLDYNVHQPWMHHSLYASHYPPYYYRTHYNNNVENGRYVRGYNENGQRAYYGSSSQYDQQRQAPAANQTQGQPRRVEGQPRQPEQNQRPGVQVQQSNQSNQPTPWNRFHDGNDLNRPSNPEPRQEQPAQRSQPVTYQHTDVGQPVRVTRQMMPPRNNAGQPQNQQQSRPVPQQPAQQQQSRPEPQQREGGQQGGQPRR